MTGIWRNGAAAVVLTAAGLITVAACGPATHLAASGRVTLPAVTGGKVRALWQGAPWGNLTFAGGTLLGVDGNQVDAVRAATGKLIWTATIPASLPQILGLVPAGDVVIVEAGHTIGQAPAAVVPIVSTDVALDLATGARRWTAPVGGQYQSPPIAASGTLLLTGDPAETVTARIAATGAVVWRDPRPAACQPAGESDGGLGSPALGVAADGSLAAASWDCGPRVVVRRFDPATGKPVWTWQSPAVPAGAVQSLSVVAAARDGGLVLLAGQVASPPAAQQFLARFPHPDTWPPVLGPADQISTVLALDAAVGRPRWSELGGQLETPALTAGAACELVSAGLECRDDATGAPTIPALLTGMTEGSPPYADDGFAGVSGGLAAVTQPHSGGVTLRVVSVSNGATVARAYLAIGTTTQDGSSYQVFAVTAGQLTPDTTLVLVRRVDLPGYPVLALAVPDPVAA
jgi:outer membrane protein assembly factor BamB